MKINIKPEKEYTHGGNVASKITPEQQLKRSVLSCMLWENEHYEDGKTIATRIAEFSKRVSNTFLSGLAIEARERMKLRHIPLYLATLMAEKHSTLTKDTIARIIQRPDELTELLAIYWRNGRKPISAQIKKGLAIAFTKFNEYSLQKYNRDSAIKLRDVMFMVHPKPINKEQEAMWKRLVNNELAIPDTWEVLISATSGKNKKNVWEKLLKEDKLGALALIRNLRNFEECGVNQDLVKSAILTAKTDRVLPFRFVSAAKHAPRYEKELEIVMLNCLSSQEKLPGKTVLIVDVSGSMYGTNVSAKSEISRAHAASALGILAREMCENIAIYATAGNDYTRVHKTALVPSRRGFALSDYIYEQKNPLGGGGIFLKQVMDYVYDYEKEVDRIIVITDEQDCDNSVNSPSKANAFGKQNYIINVSSTKNGIAYDKWVHINGFSEAVLDYILEYERTGN